jgi:GT2 family glycosyltransferase
MYKVSAIIPTIGRLKVLINTINSINQQTIIPNELIIIDQNESDTIKKLIVNNKLYDKLNIKYIHNKNITGLAQARNVGVKNVSSDIDIVLFLDDDVILEKMFIEEILKVYEIDDNINGVGGVITNYSKSLYQILHQRIFNREIFYDTRQIVYSKYLKIENYLETRIIGGGLMSFRKEIFNRYLFDEHYIGYSLGEDVDFSWRVSQEYKLVINPKARLEHIRSKTGRYDLFEQYKSRVACSMYLFNKNISSLSHPIRVIVLNLIGQLIHSLLICVKVLSVKPIFGYITGLYCSYNKFKEIKFLKL